MEAVRLTMLLPTSRTLISLSNLFSARFSVSLARLLQLPARERSFILFALVYAVSVAEKNHDNKTRTIRAIKIPIGKDEFFGKSAEGVNKSE